MVKLDIYSGLLGNGKTTLIKKMLDTAYLGCKVAIIENEVGAVNLDAEEFAENSVRVKEVTSGCLCCTVKGSFQKAVQFIVEQENPEYIIVEPTGTADIQGVIEACKNVERVELNRCIMVVNARKIGIFLKAAGEFFYDQICTAQTIYLNFTEQMDKAQVESVKESLRKINPELEIVDVPLEKLTKDAFLKQGDCCGKDRDVETKYKLEVCGANELIKVRPMAERTKRLFTWTYYFQKAFSLEDIDRLFAVLEDRSHCILWRAKGYLLMIDGTIRKIDAAYGDFYHKEKPAVSKEKAGSLVLIGPKLDICWLQKQLSRI